MRQIRCTKGGNQPCDNTLIYVHYHAENDPKGATLIAFQHLCKDAEQGIEEAQMVG